MDIKVDDKTVIVFDLDDTIYNELDYLKSAYQHIAVHLQPKNWKPLYATMFSLYRCKENVFDVLVSKFDIDHHTLIDMYRYHFPKIELFEGVFSAMQNIKSKGGKIGIITDGRAKTQMAKIRALGIYDIIDKIIISEEIGTEKPNKKNFKAIENAIEGNDYCYIADNLKKDFLTPNALGWNSVGLIDNGKNIHSQCHAYMAKEHMPKHFILSYKELNIT